MGLDDLIATLDRLPAAPINVALPTADTEPPLDEEEQAWLAEVEAVFTEQLPAVVPGWESRPQQLQMARTVARGLWRGQSVLAEAGTGTGKSVAQLAPAVLHARRTGATVLLSTGTHVLQEQYMTKDVSLLQQAIGDFEVALAKGRGNYLCLKRLNEEAKQLSLDGNDPISALRTWADQTQTGDKAELTQALASEFGRVCADDSCTGVKCPLYDECFLYKARRRMAGADVVICNHALLMADLAVRDASFGNASLLPTAGAIIIDEAHHLEDAARGSFGVVLTETRLGRLLRDLRQKAPLTGAELAGICHSDHGNLWAALVSELGNQDRAELQRAGRLADALQALIRSLEELRREIRVQAKRAPSEEVAADLDNLHDRLERYELDLAVLADPGDDFVVWAERSRTNAGGERLTAYATPVQVAKTLRHDLFSVTVVCSSATLAVNRSFDHFKASVGAPDDTLEYITDSPFDYQQQCLLYVPADLPDPKAADYHAQIAEGVYQLLAASRGRAFVLCTSYRGMRALYDSISMDLPYRCLYQGQMSRGELIEAFAADVHSVLFATVSFWEGVDVPGEALSCVILDRLPFSVPDDPITRAKIRAIEAAGGNAFMHHSVPEAVLRMRQGFGRLIRTQADRGVVAVMDRRLLQARYGRIFLNSLPRARMVRRLEDVQRFFGEGQAA